jgi:hypothetical protein
VLEELFRLLEERLKTECCFVNSVAMYQQQDIFQSESLGFKPTVVFIDFQNLQYSGNGTVQECDFELVLRVVVEEYSKNYFKALRQKDNVVKAIHNYIGLQRISESIDTNADSLYVYTITYSGNFIETFDDEFIIDIGGTSGINWNYDLGLVMDSNHDEVYTSWNGSAGVEWSAGVFYGSDYIEQTFTNQLSVTVTHNWNRKPNVSIIDSQGNILEGEVQYVNDNIIYVSFAHPETGKIIIQS